VICNLHKLFDRKTICLLNINSTSLEKKYGKLILMRRTITVNDHLWGCIDCKAESSEGNSGLSNEIKLTLAFCWRNLYQVTKTNSL
jgi:hypothetical protein